jgi:hypothetical protein
MKIDREIKVIDKLKKSEYNKIWSKKNTDKVKEINRLYRLKNKEKIKEINRLYRLNNKDKVKKTKRLSRLKKPHIQIAYVAKRRSLKLNATPKFANIDKIKEIYKNCPKGYHVDHIIPLNNKLVCGLHVEWNLQYLPAKENLSKSNKLLLNI